MSVNILKLVGRPLNTRLEVMVIDKDLAMQTIGPDEKDKSVVLFIDRKQAHLLKLKLEEFLK